MDLAVLVAALAVAAALLAFALRAGRRRGAARKPACAANADCAATGYCFSGACLPCKSSGDCAPGLACKGGKCTTCAVDADCGAFGKFPTSCASGVCTVYMPDAGVGVGSCAAGGGCGAWDSTWDTAAGNAIDCTKLGQSGLITKDGACYYASAADAQAGCNASAECKGFFAIPPPPGTTTSALLCIPSTAGPDTPGRIVVADASSGDEPDGTHWAKTTIG